MQLLRTVPIFVPIFVLLAACGEPSPGAPLTAAEVRDGCAVYCEYRVACGEDEAACASWCGGVMELIRGDAAHDLLGCYLDQACDAAGEQSCIAETIDGIEPTVTYGEAHKACYALEGRCDVSYGCDVTYYELLSDPTLEALIACFEAPCDEVDRCVVAVIGPL